MTKKKIITLITAVSLIAVLGIGGTLMYFTDQDTKQNVITLGKVDGTLDEETNDPDATETPDGIEYDKITPGQELSKIPTVTLADDSEDAYLRMSIDVKGLEAFSGYAKEIIDGLDIGNGWVKGNDDYYYYQTKMTKGDKSMPIFTTVTIPNTWGNEVAEATFTIDLQAELIQADNFEPVRNPANDPNGTIVGWGNVNIEEAK